MANPRGRRGGFGLGAWLLVATAAAAVAGAADLAEVKARGSLRVLAAADEDSAWVSLRGGGSPGFEREMLEGFARSQKLRFEVVPIPRWEEAIPMLLREQGDLVAGIGATAERRRRVDFTLELLPVQSVVVAQRPLEAGMRLGPVLPSAWAVRKSSPRLRRALDAHLEEVRRGPEWGRVLIRYFGDDAPAILGREPVS